MVEQSKWKEETLEMRGKTEIWDKRDVVWYGISDWDSRWLINICYMK